MAKDVTCYLDPPRVAVSFLRPSRPTYGISVAKQTCGKTPDVSCHVSVAGHQHTEAKGDGRAATAAELPPHASLLSDEFGLMSR